MRSRNTGYVTDDDVPAKFSPRHIANLLRSSEAGEELSGLKPPRIRKQSLGATPVTQNEDHALDDTSRVIHSSVSPGKENESAVPGTPSDGQSQASSNGKSIVSPELSSGSHWSTFGRHPGHMTAASKKSHISSVGSSSPRRSIRNTFSRNIESFYSIRVRESVAYIRANIPAIRRRKTDGDIRSKSQPLIPPSSLTFGLTPRKISSLPKIQHIFQLSSDPGRQPVLDSSSLRLRDSASTQPSFQLQVLGEVPALSGEADRHRTAVAEPHAPHVVANQARAAEPCPSSPLIPPRPSPPSLNPQKLLEAVNGGGGSSLRSTSIMGEGDNGSAQPNDVTGTLKGGPSTSTRAGSIGKARSNSRHTFPVASSSRLSEAGLPTSSNSFSPATFPRISSSARPARSSTEPGLTSVLEKSVLETPTYNKGKRKAEDVDITPPDPKRATFALPPESHHVSRAPTSYRHKRARLSSSPSPSPGHSRPSSTHGAANRRNSDSWPSRSDIPHSLRRAASKTASARSGRRPASTVDERRADKRRSMSEISFPLSAIITPHAPSISRSSIYHMRDPRRPPKVMPTPWVVHLRSEAQDASPLQAWFFFIGFILFPIWWVASFMPIPKTRQMGGTDLEKAVTLDDPQVEHDARTWRLRCRIMSVVSFLTYIPFIILVAIFVPR
ncbi:hypothetical protein A0H81_08458 [Grifola frondosa]|uniref:Uncharacterized protein n=1 Tax=Grifola frondosa TaxID=5627 RepID=A0A1C7M4B0_GRIFR|nr:hypothetical protein A0H81_08458 [Grifola frondosa]